MFCFMSPQVSKRWEVKFVFARYLPNRCAALGQACAGLWEFVILFPLSRYVINLIKWYYG